MRAVAYYWIKSTTCWIVHSVWVWQVTRCNSPFRRVCKACDLGNYISECTLSLKCHLAAERLGAVLLACACAGRGHHSSQPQGATHAPATHALASMPPCPALLLPPLRRHVVLSGRQLGAGRVPGGLRSPGNARRNGHPAAQRAPARWKAVHACLHRTFATAAAPFALAGTSQAGWCGAAGVGRGLLVAH